MNEMNDNAAFLRRCADVTLADGVADRLRDAADELDRLRALNESLQRQLMDMEMIGGH